jgi:terminase small subunit-like protein
LLAETLATAEQARLEVERDGFVIASGKSGHRSHPAIPVMEHSRTQAAALLDRFHLTPKSRVGAAPKGPTSVFGKNGRAVVHGSDADAQAAEFWGRFNLPE